MSECQRCKDKFPILLKNDQSNGKYKYLCKVCYKKLYPKRRIS